MTLRPERHFLIYFYNGKAVFLQCCRYFLHMIGTMGFYGNFQLYFFETVGHFCLVVIQLNDIGIFVCQNLRHFQQLSRFVRKLYGETENASTGDQGFINERRDG